MMDRRELATRKTSWAQFLGRVIANTGITPNQISVIGIFFAMGSGISFYYAGATGSRVLLFVAAACIQLRLLCNMLDGLVAVENNKKSIFGDLFNDIPDRFEDAFILVGAGLFLPSLAWLGWLAALVALLTAYLRCLGKSLGCKAYYSGPQAKQHRMFVLTLGSLLQLVYGPDPIVMELVLFCIIIGSLITFWRRLQFIARDLKEGIIK